jgi:hypothetical protein
MTRKLWLIVLVGIFVWTLIIAPMVESWFPFRSRLLLLGGVAVAVMFFGAWNTWRHQKRDGAG